MTKELETPADGFPDSPQKTGLSIGLVVAIAMGVLFLLFILFVLILLPAVRQLNRAEVREQTRINGRELVSAVRSHHRYFNRLPINKIDEEGHEIRSWRVELLPFLGQQQVSDMIDPSLPWDSKGHSLKGDRIATLSLVPVFQSPRGIDDSASITHFVCVTDPDSPMSGDRIKLEAIDSRDGQSNTALFLEFPGSDINWAEPRDVTLAEAIDIITNSDVPVGTVVALADGKTIVVPKSASGDDIAKLFLLDNGAPQGSWWNAE